MCGVSMSTPIYRYITHENNNTNNTVVIYIPLNIVSNFYAIVVMGPVVPRHHPANTREDLALQVEAFARLHLSSHQCNV